MAKPLSESKKADTYLQAESRDLRLVFAKIRELQIINEKLYAHLDPHIAKYCQAANVAGNRLILIVANGSIATQLRFQLSDLLKKLKSDPHPLIQKIHDIQCKVHPGFTLPALQSSAYPRQKMQPLSPETANMIQEMAEAIEDPKLREIMERIANRSTPA